MNPLEGLLVKMRCYPSCDYFKRITLAAVWQIETGKKIVMVRIIATVIIPMKNNIVQDQGEMKEVMKNS